MLNFTLQKMASGVVNTMNSPLRQLGKRIDDFVYSSAIQLLGGGADAYMHLAARYESLGCIGGSG